MNLKWVAAINHAQLAVLEVSVVKCQAQKNLFETIVREIFTQNRNSSSSSYEATPVPLYQNASNLKDKDSRLKDFKLEFEKKFNETIPDTNKLDKFTDLEKNYPEALKRFKGNDSFYSLIKNLK